MIPAPVSALIAIDMQNAIDADYWAKDGPRNNRNAEATGLRILKAWREQQWPVFHVRHDSIEPQSSYRPGQPGNDFKPGFGPGPPAESVISKHTGSAFTGTDLGIRLADAGISDLVVFGVITNNSVEATVRHAGTLGFRVRLVEDACFTFGKHDFFGQLRNATAVHAMSLANLEGEYCEVTTAAAVLNGLVREPILPYFERPASYHEHDPRSLGAAARIPGFEHIGSTSVPGCPGKGILDGMVLYESGGLDSTVNRLLNMGFQRQPGRDPFPDTRPMLVGAIIHDDAIFRIHAHVLESDRSEVSELRKFRDLLRSNSALVSSYAARKREILAAGISDSIDYCAAKSEFITGLLSNAV